MNSTDPQSVPTVDLSRTEKEKLLRQMYGLHHWIEIIRMFRHQTLPMAEAREAIQPIAEKFGKEPVANACEALVEISTQGADTFARLKPHIRKMAFQIIGPEPEQVTTPPPSPTPSAPTSEQERKPRRPRTRNPKPEMPPAPDTPAEAAPPKGNRDAVMEQYRAAKERHPNMLLLFRMGDFYELFAEDAEKAHKLLDLTLTTRDRTLAMAGFPHHQLEAYLHKLLKAGERVAICEPVEESVARGPIRREVARVVTDGSMIETAKPCPAESEEAATPVQGKPVRQPRHFVIKEFEKWMTAQGIAFVAVNDVCRTTPAVKPYVGVLDFIILRGDEKLLVTLRPGLQAKHLQAIRELQNLFGSDYRPVRTWPPETPDGWTWPEESIDLST